MHSHIKYIVLIFIGISCFRCSSADESPDTPPPPGAWTLVYGNSYNPINQGVCFQIGEYAYYGLGYGYAGGIEQSFGNFFKSSDGYNWTKIATYPGEARVGAVSFVLNGKAYVGTGRHPTASAIKPKYHKDFWCYNPETNEWSEATQFIGIEREGAIAFTLTVKGKNENDKPKEMSFVGCGASENEFLNDFYSFDGATWDKIEIPMGSRRYGGIAFVINNVAYICGGYKYYDKTVAGGDAELAKDIVYYKGEPNDTWGTIKNGFNNDSLPRAFATSFVVKRKEEEKGYILFGTSTIDGPSFYNETCWEFSPGTNQWSKIPNLPADIKPRTGAISFCLGNKAYVAFGEGYNGNIFKDIWEFTPEN